MPAKKQKVRILHLEDNPDDSELLRMVLDRSKLNYELTEVQTKEEYEKQKLADFDLLISDYNLNDYNGMAAIKRARGINGLLPIIILSGTVGEELAVDLLREGANDFILKSNLKKIVLAIERVLHESALALEKEQYQKQLVETTLILDTIFDSFADIIFLKDAEEKYVKVNRAFCNFLEMTEEDIIGKTDEEIFPREVSVIGREKDEMLMLTGRPLTYEIDTKDARGRRTILEVLKTPLKDGAVVTGIVGECRNITKQRLLLENEEKSKRILNQAEHLTSSGSFEYDREQDILICSANFKKMTKLKIEGNMISFRKLAYLIKEEDRALFIGGVNNSIESRTEYFQEHRFNIKNDHDLISHFKVSLTPDPQDRSGNRFYGTIVDVTAEYVNHIYMMDKQEEDRKEIARELHDNLGQKLNAVSMFVSKTSDSMPENKDLIKVKSIVHDSIDDLSFLLNNISVKQVEEHSLDYAIGKLIDYMPDSISMINNYSLREDRLSNFVKRQLYRIIQEVLNNTVKYSEASEVQMNLEQDGSILSLQISDNGKGFNLNEVKGNGLKNIKHRVRKGNGLINIDSEKGKGTRVNVRMPIN